MCDINGVELSVKQHTLSYVVGIGIGGTFRSFKELRVHQGYKYIMLMLVYKFILASSFAGWRKYFGNFTGCFRSFSPSWAFSQW